MLCPTVISACEHQLFGNTKNYNEVSSFTVLRFHFLDDGSVHSKAFTYTGKRGNILTPCVGYESAIQENFMWVSVVEDDVRRNSTGAVCRATVIFVFDCKLAVGEAFELQIATRQLWMIYLVSVYSAGSDVSPRHVKAGLPFKSSTDLCCRLTTASRLLTSCVSTPRTAATPLFMELYLADQSGCSWFVYFSETAAI